MAYLSPEVLLVILASGLGAIIGSFASVVIDRLPRMLEHDWMREACEATGASLTEASPPNLIRPGSHCPSCKQSLRWWHNIPIMSYLFLRGRCAWCHARIPYRYLAIEIAMAWWFAWCMATHDAGQISTWFWMVWGATLMTLAIMDWRTFLLPDALTVGLLWATLVVAALGGLPLSATDAILGAAVGYLVLFLPAWGFERVTGRTGMAHGDFKLMAAVGAAAGPDQVIVVLLFASLLGIAVAWKAQRWVPKGTDIGASDIAPGAVPFGPMIAAAAMTNLVWPIESLALQW